MGAALSYYTVFSLAPMLLIVIAVAGLVFGQDAARGALFEQLSGLMESPIRMARRAAVCASPHRLRRAWRSSSPCHFAQRDGSCEGAS